MEKISVLNANNELIEVNVVRYFKHENDYFLIFTYGEKDEKGYEKLYIVQVLDELGEKVVRNINDVDEWNDIQTMVKDSIKQIKKGNDNNIEKLNVYELNNIKIEEPRSFNIDPKLVQLLEMDIVDDVDLGTHNNDTTEHVDFEKMYYALKADHDATELLMNELMDKLILYKQKYGELSE